MDTYPKNQADFDAAYDTEAKRAAFLADLRIAEGLECQYCKRAVAWRRLRTRPVLVCKSCHRQTNITVGTAFEESRLKLSHWFKMLWWIAKRESEYTDWDFCHEMGFGSKTGWSVLRRIRYALSNPPPPLDGDVVVEDMYIGKEGNDDYLPRFAGVVHLKDGQIRAEFIDPGDVAMVDFITKNVQKGSRLFGCEDTLRAALIKRGYTVGDKREPRGESVKDLYERWEARMYGEGKSHRRFGMRELHRRVALFLLQHNYKQPEHRFDRLIRLMLKPYPDTVKKSRRSQSDSAPDQDAAKKPARRPDSARKRVEEHRDYEDRMEKHRDAVQRRGRVRKDARFYAKWFESAAPRGPNIGRPRRYYKPK